jgi:hypothetical protein
MSEFYDELFSSVAPQLTEKLSGKADLSHDQIQGALAGLAPVVLSQLKKSQANMSENDLDAMLAKIGSEDVDHAVSQASAFDLDGDDDDNDLTAHGLLEKSQGDATAQALSQKLGISGGVARKLLPMLIPVIISMLMKKGQQDTATKTRAGGIFGILDRDGDGQIIDDIASMIFSGGGKSAGGGMLASILGGLMKR